MTSPLNDKLKSVKWGGFVIGDLFDIATPKKRFYANKVTVFKVGKWPYIVRTRTCNGQKGFINEDERYLNEGNTISFGQDTATMFYQETPYFTGDKIKVFKPKYERFGKENAQFFIATMIKSFSSFSWGASSFSVDIIKNQRLNLPIINDDVIDFDFIEGFIAELEAYLTAAGLKDYNLTIEEQQALDNYNDLIFNEFNVVDIFDVKNTGNILSRDIKQNSGSTPYLCASSENNGVSSYISYDKRYLENGGCIFIGGKTFVVSYQENDFYSNDSHNLILSLKGKNGKTKSTQLYLATCVHKSLNHKYSWGDSISNKKIQKDTISLPSKSNHPEFSSMEILISAIQKLVIKDVAQYADQKIATHKKVVKSGADMI
ncbi:type II restriction endonuclease subunit R [Candidatus Williamhamiltonella defendens]|uniref:Type II restriction endonuclease subunit R n=1 Tax=Candidatus Williamhamiltonella defendens TaxID=138072 RepID=A0AAC9VK56_9ENTR|nr:restriction endonuclease subunit S [Candidatus Hamiltonella defensa]ASV33355.1 type II restriction endonuclease subunit R [Candidatus Hamiltonella defensa]AWK16310.1 type II restriction endonuclease subunit R [Candidatus Hamiltonella defensa]